MASMLANPTSQAALCVAGLITLVGFFLIVAAVAREGAPEAYVIGIGVLIVGGIALYGAWRFRRAHLHALAECRTGGETA